MEFEETPMVERLLAYDFHGGRRAVPNNSSDSFNSSTGADPVPSRSTFPDIYFKGDFYGCSDASNQYRH